MNATRAKLLAAAADTVREQGAAAASARVIAARAEVNQALIFYHFGTVSASFIGLQLYDGIDADGAAHALDSLERLAVLVEVVNDLGPIARRALRTKLKGVRGAAPTADTVTRSRPVTRP